MTRPFAAIGEDDIEGESLLDVVKRVSFETSQLYSLLTDWCAPML